MGVGKLPQTVERVLAAGKSPETPVALIRWGTRSEQETITGTLSDIAQKVEHANFKPPAVIVIGEVVNLRDKLSWFENKKLLGKNILVTRPRKQASSFVEMIESEAGNAIMSPTIKIKAPKNDESLKQAIKNLKKYTHLIFTSVNGVKYFMQILDFKKLDLRALAGMNIIAIGSKTAAELKVNGIRSDFIPEDYSTAGILEYLEKLESIGKINFKDASFLLPRADIAPQLLEKELKKRGSKVNNVEAYRTKAVSLDKNVLNLIQKADLDLLTFTSSSTIDNFIKGLEQLIKAENQQKDSLKINRSKIFKQLKKIPTACIGPVTAERAKDYGLNLKIAAEEYTIEGLFTAILKYYS
jgi:uroporphyrinogen III methyltransferase/synthase